MKEKLNVASSVFLILAGVTVITETVMTHFNRSDYEGPSMTSPLSTSEPHSQLSVGNVFKLPNTDWKSHRSTLVIALQKGCIYCEASVPFYQRLAVAIKGKDKLGIVVVAPSGREPDAEYLSSAQLSNVGTIRAVSFRDIGILGTPSVFLVDSTGHIQKVWFGKLKAADEHEVLDMVAAQS